MAKLDLDRTNTEGYKSIRSKSNLSQFWSVRSNFKSIRPALVNLSQLKTIRPKNVG